MKKQLWHLMIDNARPTLKFSSEKRLRQYAKEHNIKIRESLVNRWFYDVTLDMSQPLQAHYTGGQDHRAYLRAIGQEGKHE